MLAQILAIIDRARIRPQQEVLVVRFRRPIDKRPQIWRLLPIFSAPQADLNRDG